jgi:DNA-binding NarL/FixJ family response regulator
MATRVLLVEVDAATRVALTQRLGKDGRVELAGATGVPEEAARLVNRTHPDVILLGARDGDRRALIACEALSRLSSAPIVLLVSFVTPAFWEAAQRAGATAYVEKQIDTSRLVSEVCLVAERHAPAVRKQAR